MTLATTTPEQEGQHYNFLAVFNKAKKSSSDLEAASDIIKENTVGNRLFKVLGSNGILTIVSFKVIPAGKLFVYSKYLVTVKLTEQFENNFVLLRGFLEFSRPKNISISSRATDQTFQIEVLETQVDYLLSFVETILGWFVREINFKATLKAIINFENRVRHEQAILYSNMRSSIV